ncbi:hypothetical protein SCHPADRAFT_446111 [Schizopora paradoxa]|uniref:Uncharacterized protein n=1 Tax=Schizopora paradoxa TaxID=27342 RepID=A0A0H2RJA7_9AGAM|nr:hypothetical protein SCHPADRAFT_446111 [Schizopora paradoxa]
MLASRNSYASAILRSREQSVGLTPGGSQGCSRQGTAVPPRRPALVIVLRASSESTCLTNLVGPRRRYVRRNQSCL